MRYKNMLRSLIISAIAAFGVTSLAQHSPHSGRSTGTLPKPHRSIEDEELKPHIGFLFGSSRPVGDRNGGSDFGIDIGVQPYVPFGIGLELAASGNEAEQARMMVRGTYNFGGHIPLIKYSYIGAAIGPIWGSKGDANKVLIGSAPLLGFDFPIRDHANRDRVSLGLTAKFIFIEGSDPDTVNVNAIAKYWF